MPRRKPPAIPDGLLDQLLDGSDPRAALADGGLLDGLKKALAERALNAELDHHLEGGEPDGRANGRDGYGGKTVLTGTREIQGHLRELYGIEVSPDLVSAVTDAVLDEVAEWQNRPLEPLYPLVFLDALRVKVRDEGTVRNKAVHVALGVRADGTKEVLGLWIERTEGAKFWLRVMNELKDRGVEDILIAVVDGLKGFPEAIAAVFPRTQVQACVVHLIRSSLAYVSYKDRKAVAAALKEVYRARDAEAGQAALDAFDEGPWGRKYPVIAQTRRRHWTEVIPFYAFPADVRRIIYTTNSIEALHSKLRRAVRARGHFPTDEAVLKLLFLVLNLAAKEWRKPAREWTAAKAQFAILFEDRFAI